MANSRPASPLERRLGRPVETWTHAAPPAWKTAAVEGAEADGGTHDDAGEKTVDLGMFSEARSNTPGQPSTVNPLSVLQQQMVRLQNQIQSIVSRFPLLEQGVQGMQGQIDQLAQQGQISSEAANQMQSQLQEMWGQIQQPGLGAGDQQAPAEEVPAAPVEQDPSVSPDMPQEAAPAAPGPAQVPPPPEVAAGAGPAPFPEQEAGGLMQPAQRKVQPPNKGGPRQSSDSAPQAEHVETNLKSAEETPFDQGEDDPIHPLELVQLMDEAYGQGWENWEFETLVQTLAEDLEITPDERVQAMMGAVQVLKANPEAFWTDYNVFEDVVLGLNGVTPNFGGPDDVSPGQLVYGVHIANDLAPLPKDGEPDTDVKVYTALRMLEAGMVLAIHPLEWAQEEMVEEAHRRGLDTSIDLGEVQRRFVELIHTSLEDAPLSPADPIDNQVAAMMTVRDYMNLMEPMAPTSQEDTDDAGNDAVRPGSGSPQ